jgi:hypothetical protein
MTRIIWWSIECVKWFVLCKMFAHKGNISCNIMVCIYSYFSFSVISDT